MTGKTQYVSREPAGAGELEGLGGLSLMMLSGIGIVKALGLVGSLGGAYGAYVTHPAVIASKKLSNLFRMGNVFLSIQGYKGRQIKKYPSFSRKDIRIYLNRTELSFVLPIGLMPDEVYKKKDLFYQSFGSELEFELSKDKRRFFIKAYNEEVKMFDYDQNKVAERIKDIPLPILVGNTQSGLFAYNMVENPHLLVTGETGSGKSLQLRSILTTLLTNCKDRIELYCADLKRTEFHIFNGIAKEVVIKPNDLRTMLLKITKIMTQRGNLLNKKGFAHVDDLPEDIRPKYIVIAIDEVALLKNKRNRDILETIEEISAIGRSLGVFLILSLQRADATIMDGGLKNNLTVRMAFRASNVTNSRIAIDSGEASEIMNKEKGRFVFSLDGLKFAQAPSLALSDAKSMLEPFKRKEVTEENVVDLREDEFSSEEVGEEEEINPFGVLVYEN
ncbi:FtsK/SpoIIIE domain-containing protein [Paenibacillus sp. Marseille-Q4541]|uniref:FtsK/SpoIIIE domain-containing protein n=1 Tax=Paenibacillus sp. Marseille-Q4541 TaxID=2831522 RepID=UPI001BA48D94|nr:FtsK/SpoIIIE domain-containing protein [Paenibacillus sp. Marseille-Q4541]